MMHEKYDFQNLKKPCVAQLNKLISRGLATRVQAL